MSDLLNIRPFMDTLREVEYGHLLNDLSDIQREILDGVSETQKKGSLTITLEYIPEGDGQVTIVAKEPKASIPQMPRGKTLFFLTPERNLTRHDPRQMALDGLRKVSDDNTQPAKVINNG